MLSQRTYIRGIFSVLLFFGISALIICSNHASSVSTSSLSANNGVCSSKLSCGSSKQKKTIAVFGGTGKLGRECVFQALNAGHKVLVLSKNADKIAIPPGSGGKMAELPIDSPNLQVLKGDVMNPSDVDKLFDADTSISGVIVALGGRTKDVGPTMLSTGTKNIIDSMKRKSKAKRISTVTSIGAGDSAGKAPWKFKILMYTVMRSIFADKNRQEQLFLDVNGPGHDLE
jgi:nucleoside-diphosphate-sugar epimerase